MKHLPPLAAGVYVPTPAFISIAAHAAVMFERNSGLVATTGRAEDPEAQEYARLFAAAPEMLAALEAADEASHLRSWAMGSDRYQDNEKARQAQIEAVRLRNIALIKAGVRFEARPAAGVENE